jgi:hypothetical protein
MAADGRGQNFNGSYVNGVVFRNPIPKSTIASRGRRSGESPGALRALLDAQNAS